MAWVKIDDQFTDHPKAADAGPLGIAMQVAGLCYSNRHLTDGFISRKVAAKLLDFTGIALELPYPADPDDSHVSAMRVIWERICTSLVDAGLWEVVEGGWQIHDFLEYNPSRADILAKRAADLERKRTPKRTSSASEDIPNGIHTDSKRPVPGPVPIPHKTTKGTPPIPPVDLRSMPPPKHAPPSGGERVRAAPKPTTLNAVQQERFDRWYKAYPNKQHRPEAERAWRKLDPDNDLTARLVNDVEQRRGGRKWSEGYVEYPATYLNQRVFDDDIEPLRQRSVAHALTTMIAPNGQEVTLGQRTYDNIRAIDSARDLYPAARRL